MQGVADANGKFLHVSTGYAGSIHDACVLQMSSLLTAIEDGDILHSPLRRFMNIRESHRRADQREDTEEILRGFLEKELGYDDAKEVEIQLVHRVGKGKNGGPCPILAHFLQYKDCEDILALGRWLHGMDYQMFRDLPAEIIGRRKPQVKTLKKAKKNGIQAAFSTAQPDKLYTCINGKFWPVGGHNGAPLASKIVKPMSHLLILNFPLATADAKNSLTDEPVGTKNESEIHSETRYVLYLFLLLLCCVFIFSVLFLVLISILFL